MVTLFSCTEKINVTNFDFKPTIQTPSESVTNVEQALSFTITVTGLDESTSEELEVSFSIKDGIGKILLDDKSYDSGERFSHNFITEPVLKLKYLPKNSGLHQVSFGLSNSKVNKNVSFDVEVNDMIINISTENIPQIPVLEKRFSFDLILSGENLNDLGECALKASISKGAGEVYKDDILISQSGKTGVLKEGRNVISYYAKEAGENILKFDITSQYGYSQELLLPIEIRKPEFTVLSSIDVDSLPVAPAAQDFSFKLKLTDDYSHDGMTFKGKYRFISNTGAIKVNSKSVTSGAETEFKLGDNIIVFNGSDAGIVEMEFIITNQYGVQKIERVRFDVGGGNISLEARQIHSEVDLLDSTPIELTIVRPGYSGTFELQVTAIKGSGYITFNRAEYAVSGGWIRGLSNKETIQFKPDRIEDTELEITVRDPKGETVSEPVILKYKINNPPIQLQVKGYSSDIMINNQKNFSFVLSKKNYSGKYRYIVSQEPNCGNILVEGKNVSNILSLITNPLNVPVQFTPTTYTQNGEVKLNFTFTDDYNTIKDTTIIFNILTPDINVWFDSDRKEYPIGEAVSFISKISSQGHDNKPFDISLKSKNMPLVTWNGTRFNTSSTMKAVNEQTNDVSLTPFTKGDNPIIFVITDQYGKSIEKEITVVGTVENKISFTQMSTPVLLPETSKGSITIKSNDPNNRFYASYKVLKGAGTMRFNGSLTSPGQKVQIHSGDKEAVIPIEYSSNGVDGEAIIEVTITDEYGNEHRQNITTVFRGEIVITGNVRVSGKIAYITVSSSDPVKDDIMVKVMFNYAPSYSSVFYVHIRKGETSGTTTETTNDRFSNATLQLLSVSPEIGGEGYKYVVKN